MQVTELNHSIGYDHNADVSVTTAESAPSAAGDGYAIGGKKRALVLVKDLSSIVDYSLQGYVYGGASGNKDWCLLNNADFDNVGNNTFAEWFDVEGFERFEMIVDAITGTSLKRSILIL